MSDFTGLAIAGRIATRLEQAMRPWAADGSYFNFTEGPCDVDSILPPQVCARLAEVKRAYDPDDRIVANHAVSWFSGTLVPLWRSSFRHGPADMRSGSRTAHPRGRAARRLPLSASSPTK